VSIKLRPLPPDSFAYSAAWEDENGEWYAEDGIVVLTPQERSFVRSQREQSAAVLVKGQLLVLAIERSDDDAAQAILNWGGKLTIEQK
jgi:hypothetical protein